MTGECCAAEKYSARVNIEFDVASRVKREKCGKRRAKIFISFRLLSLADKSHVRARARNTQDSVVASCALPRGGGGEQIGSKRAGVSQNSRFYRGTFARY